jgi:anti-anti-sigma factor
LVAGELDMVTQEQLSRMLTNLLLEWDSVELDLENVTFIDSTGVHALIRAACPSIGSNRVSLGRRSSVVDRVLSLLGVDDRLQLPG